MLDGPIRARSAHFSLHGLQLPAAQVEITGLFAGSDVWIGAMVPKRWARRAVTRNTIKRQIYAVSRASLAQSKPAAYVVRLRSGLDPARFFSASSMALKQAMRTELLSLFSENGALA